MRGWHCSSRCAPGVQSPYPPLQGGWECGAPEAWQGQCCGHCPLSSQCNLNAITISSCTSFYQTLMITKNPTRGTCLPFWDTSHGRIIPFVLVQQSSPGMMERAALGSAHIRNQQGWRTPPLAQQSWGAQALTPTAEISPCLKEGMRPLFLFFGPLDFQVQTWRCAQCNFSIRKSINCAPWQSSASRRGFTISKTLFTALF